MFNVRIQKSLVLEGYVFVGLKELLPWVSDVQCVDPEVRLLRENVLLMHTPCGGLEALWVHQTVWLTSFWKFQLQWHSLVELLSQRLLQRSFLLETVLTKFLEMDSLLLLVKDTKNHIEVIQYLEENAPQSHQPVCPLQVH